MEKSTLNIFCLGGPLLSTEWVSLLGDKYRSHMDFEPVIVSEAGEADVVVWDGVLTPKSSMIITEFLEKLSEKTTLLITGEAKTLFLDHPFVKLHPKMLDAVYLPPSRMLPEEILEALAECRMKGTHV